MNITCVLIHGSALTAHASKRDVDVIFSGDRTKAAAIARAWADEHGCAGLPLDIHESDRGAWADGTMFFSVPSVPGNGAPYEVISGQPKVFVREYTGLASLLRMRATASVIAAAIRAQGRARIALVGQNDEWGNYVDGAVALRSAIRHAMQNGVWEGLCVDVPGVTRLAETVAEFGVGRLSKQTIDQIGRGGGWVDITFDGNPRGGVTAATHAREGDAWWASPQYLADAIERGERSIAVDDRVLVRSYRRSLTPDGALLAITAEYDEGRVYDMREGECLVRVVNDTHWIDRGALTRISEAREAISSKDLCSVCGCAWTFHEMSPGGDIIHPGH